MKKINLTDDDKIQLLKETIEKFKKKLDDFDEDITASKFEFSANVSSEAKEKIRIVYDSSAYLKMKALVDAYDTEVSWYGLIRKINDKEYYVYDVKVYKQTVGGAKVDTEDEDILAFWDSLSDEEFNDLHFQAHSHVRMSTSASCVDLGNQRDIIRNMGQDGFFMFQIWNKQGDINTYLYDLTNNMFYDRKDIEIDFLCGDETASKFIKNTKELVKEKKYEYYPMPKQNGLKQKKSKEVSYLPYYNDYGYERWTEDEFSEKF